MVNLLAKKLIKPVLYLCVFLLVCSNVKSQNKPNILFIAVDDLKPTISCFDDTLAITPNIDNISKKGLIFTKNYCQQAVCAPSRASLLTSRYPDQTQVWDLETLIRDKTPDIITLPQYFKENGYLTYGVGKIFDSRSVDNQNDAKSWSSYGNPYQNKYYDSTTGKPSYYYATQHAKDTIALLKNEAKAKGVNIIDYVKKYYWPSTENANVPYNAYIDGAIAQSGMDLMAALKTSQKPFFLAVGFHRPHLPFNAPKQFWDLYNRNQFRKASFQQKAANSPALAYHNFGELRGYTDIPASGNINSDKQIELIHAYYAAVSYIDFCIGLLTDKLNELGLAENTIIVLWGDHGWHLGDHNLWCKHSNFEQATRAPLIISYPNQPNRGTKYNYPTEFTDIAPTLCELCGLDIPVDFEGQSLLPAFETPNEKIREGALSQYPRWDSGTKYMGYSIRTERFRYTKWVDKNTKAPYKNELYDYENDPLETINEANNNSFKEVVNYLDSLVTTRIFLPSTQKKVKFSIKTVNEKGDTINMYFADVLFYDKHETTNQSGEVLFTQIPGSYPYLIQKNNFIPVSSEFSLNNDTTINIYLKKIISQSAQTKTTGFRIWPNPFKNKLIVEIHKNQKALISLLNNQGKQLKIKTIGGSSIAEFTTSDLPSGNYILNVTGNFVPKTFQIIKIN